MDPYSFSSVIQGFRIPYIPYIPNWFDSPFMNYVLFTIAPKLRQLPGNQQAQPTHVTALLKNILKVLHNHDRHTFHHLIIAHLIIKSVDSFEW